RQRYATTFERNLSSGEIAIPECGAEYKRAVPPRGAQRHRLVVERRRPTRSRLPRKLPPEPQHPHPLLPADEEQAGRVEDPRSARASRVMAHGHLLDSVALEV